jgi:hypothetical protein
MFGGLGWLSFLYPPLGYCLFPYIAALGLLGAASLILWLLVFGVNEQRWKERPVQRGIGDSSVPCTLDSMLRVRNDYEHSSDEGKDCRCFLLVHREFLSSKNLI